MAGVTPTVRPTLIGECDVLLLVRLVVELAYFRQKGEDEYVRAVGMEIIHTIHGMPEFRPHNL